VFYVWFDAPHAIQSPARRKWVDAEKARLERWWRYGQGRTTWRYTSSWARTTVPLPHARLSGAIMRVARAVEACGLHQVFNYLNYDGGPFFYSRGARCVHWTGAEILPADLLALVAACSHAPENRGRRNSHGRISSLP